MMKANKEEALLNKNGDILSDRHGNGAPVKTAVRKYSVCGNDFVFVTNMSSDVSLDRFARLVCDRRGGLGADQLVRIEPETPRCARLQVFNPDGSVAPFCANAMLAAGYYLSQMRNAEGSSWRFVLWCGELQCEHVQTERVSSISLPSRVIHSVGSGIQMPQSIHEAYVTCGTNHYVVVLSDFSDLDLAKDGPRLERSAVPNHSTNVMFARICTEGQVEVIPWERGGSGATSACGSGAYSAAAVVADYLATHTERAPKAEWDVRFPGGTLRIQLDHQGGRLFGDPREIFSGMYFHP